MESYLHFGGDCGGFADESAARPLVARPNGSVPVLWVAPRREVDCFERVWTEYSTIPVSCVSPNFVAGTDAFCFAGRSLSRFAAFPYCARVLREGTSASMTNTKTPESADCGLVQAVPRLISTITSLRSGQAIKHLELK